MATSTFGAGSCRPFRLDEGWKSSHRGDALASARTTLHLAGPSEVKTMTENREGGAAEKQRISGLEN